MPAATPPVNVLMLRAFDGPRHARLRAIWDVLAEYNRANWRLCRFAAQSRTHAQGLNAMWEEELRRPERFAVITEEDFLPDWERFIPLDLLCPKRPIFCAEYATRDPNTLKLAHHRIPGAWYILVDKHKVGPLDFSCSGPFNDPANGLVSYVHKAYGVETLLIKGKDCLPAHYGISYPTGQHLFWSRHYNDPPELRPAGFDLGAIQRLHDAAVTRYLQEAPEGFKALWKARHPTPCTEKT